MRNHKQLQSASTNSLIIKKSLIMRNLKLFLIVAIAFFMAIETSIAQTASVMPIGRSFIIQSAQTYGRGDGGCWDLAGWFENEADFIKGTNLNIYKLDQGADRYITIKESSQQGYYELMIGKHSIARVDIKGGNQTKGTNIQLWDDNNTSSQRFLFKHLGNGRFKIYTTEGKIINLASQSANNGNNLQIWDDHDGIHNEWYLLDATTRKAYVPKSTIRYSLNGEIIPQRTYYIQSAVSYGRNSLGFWDIPGSGISKLKNMANLQIYLKSSEDDRKFLFIKNSKGDYYNIRIGYTNYRVDLIGGNTGNGSNVAAYERNGKSNQDFYLKHLGNGRFKIFHKSGKLLALANGAIDKNSTNIHLWQDHNAVQAEWYLIDVQTGKTYIPEGNNPSNEGDGWNGESNEGGSSGSESGGW